MQASETFRDILKQLENAEACINRMLDYITTLERENERLRKTRKSQT